jgi:flagellin-like protein
MMTNTKKNRLLRSKRGITPVIAIILLLMMTVAAAGAAYLWITKIQKTITTQAEKQIMTSFQQGTLQVVSAYTCEKNCTEDTSAKGSTGKAGECAGPSDTAIIMLSADQKTLPTTGTIGTTGKNTGTPDAVACQIQNHLCLMMRNTGNTVVRMTDLGSAQVVYEVPEAPEMGERPLPSKYIGAIFTNENGSKEYCCRFSTMSTTSQCSDKKSIASRETFIVSMFGTFTDAASKTKRMTYTDTKDQRIIIGMNLPSGFKVTHQVV